MIFMESFKSKPDVEKCAYLLVWILKRGAMCGVFYQSQSSKRTTRSYITPIKFRIATRIRPLPDRIETPGKGLCT